MALTPPLIVAALVVVLAGLTKLRAPADAAEALATLGLRGPRLRAGLVRTLAVLELALGTSALASGSPALRLALGALYLGFAAVAAWLVRRGADCGCFGDAGVPASWLQVGLNLAFASVCLTGGAAHAAGVRGVLGLAGWQSPVALLGLAAATGAVVLAYTELPRAWGAWSGGPPRTPGTAG